MNSTNYEHKTWSDFNLCAPSIDKSSPNALSDMKFAATENFRTGTQLILVLAFSLIVCVSCKPQTAQLQGTTVHPMLPAPDFTLTDHQGKKFKLSDQIGHIVIMFFGFTHCPDVCPTTMVTLRKIKQDLGEDASSVRFLFITVDPDRDQIGNLNNYIGVYDENFLGLLGSPQELEAVYEAYGIYRELDNADDESKYLINHTNSIFIIDIAGNWRLNYADTTRKEDIIHDVRLLLKE